jgi:hypothetical protein
MMQDVNLFDLMIFNTENRMLFNDRVTPGNKKPGFIQSG